MITDLVNGVVHVLSALFFLVLLYLLLKNRKEQALLRSFLRGDLQKRVNVDWPLVFPEEFCSALKIPFSGSGAMTAGAPRRLYKELIFETLLLYGIDAIQYSVDADRNIHLTFQVVNTVLERELLEQELSRALQLTVRVLSFKDQRS